MQGTVSLIKEDFREDGTWMEWRGGEKTLGPNVPKYVEAVISFVRTVKYERAISPNVWKFCKQTTCLLFYPRFHSFWIGPMNKVTQNNGLIINSDVRVTAKIDRILLFFVFAISRA